MLANEQLANPRALYRTTLKNCGEPGKLRFAKYTFRARSGEAAVVQQQLMMMKMLKAELSRLAPLLGWA